ncbi:MAG: tRNA pseudouridine(38-40) synthase TruA [Acutalibacteraceae bacterium]|nr:tRNA pseudouridine(38-40) synthase TruA [Acutalibacteraceae bacterium]
MKRILLTISYDGTAYHGWQVQPNGITVQETVQNALYKLLDERPALTGCSRTDAGVHAREFCCHLDCDEKFPENAFLKGLDALLPEDISVKAVREVPPDFHARYNAKGKTYAYYILNNTASDPFLSRYTWKIERSLDLERMNAFCKEIIGSHDFFAFSASGRTVEDTVRTVSECYAVRENDKVILKITADGFLYNMVRIIVGTAVAVSDGKIEPSFTKEIFALKNRALAGQTAPPQGLFLEKVWY